MKDEYGVVDVLSALDRIEAKLLRMGASFERTATSRGPRSTSSTARGTTTATPGGC
ncbi:MAG: hypothetical protein IPG17_30125 [Sandaracinaceae bacterium]|nr:hypothetical protein [Sandaracinaceae bacterium]